MPILPPGPHIRDTDDSSVPAGNDYILLFGGETAHACFEDLARVRRNPQTGFGIAALGYEDLPPEAVYWSRVAVLDTVGVTLAGAVEEAPRMVEDVLELQASAGPSLIFGKNRRVACLDAALVNGTAAHALDFDNTSNTLAGHMSATMIPALIAAGEALSTSLAAGTPSDNPKGAEVRVTLTDGRAFSVKVDRALGRTAQNPIPLEQLKMKFQDCAGRVLAPEAIAAASRMIDSFEEVGPVRDFTALLEPAGVRTTNVPRSLARGFAH